MNKMKYNPLLHHRDSIRLKGYDYSKEGLYFITICTNDRLCFFGNVKDGKMVLNEKGGIAKQCWSGIPLHYPNVVLHEYVVMPNHVHGIIELTVAPAVPADVVGVQNLGVRVQNFEPLQQRHEPQRNQFQKIIPRSVGSIIRGYKIGVTKWFRENTDVHTVWQRNFYEHIIRNEQSFENIARYIVNNPANWKEDKFYK